MLVAFSCKGRGICPSCGARRMCNETVQLVDPILPNVPIRQWALSLPWELRGLAARERERERKAQCQSILPLAVAVSSQLRFLVSLFASQFATAWPASAELAASLPRYGALDFPTKSCCRISRSEWEDPKKRPMSSKETRHWTIGEDGRTNGSLHSDWWTGKAVELAQCGRIAVYPVTGCRSNSLFSRPRCGERRTTPPRWSDQLRP